MHSPKNAESLVLRRLAVREHSAAELRDYLTQNGIDAAEADRVIQDFIERKVIDDRRFAEVMARHQALRGKGPTYVQAKLREKGVLLSLAEIRDLWQEASPETEASRIRKILDRHYPDAQADAQSRRRAMQGLLRRGFSMDAIREALK